MLNGARFVHVVFSSSQLKLRITYKLSFRTKSQEELYFQAMVFMSNEICKKKLNMFKNSVYSTLAGVCSFFTETVGWPHQVLVGLTIGGYHRAL